MPNPIECTRNITKYDEQNYIQAADMLSTDLYHIHNWSHNWAIKFNPNKTESVLFTRRNINNPSVYFGDMDNRVTFLCMGGSCHTYSLELNHLLF
jgi:hypothetical protein